MMLGTVISSSVGKNRDGETSVRLLQVQIADTEDVQTVEYAQAAGEDYNPPPGTAVFIIELGTAWKLAIAADDLIEPSVAVGEKEIYAQAAGIKKSAIRWFLDGTIEAKSSLTAGTDYVAIAEKVDNFIQQVVDLLTGAGTPPQKWIVVPQDGGAALQVAAGQVWPTAPASTASTNLKADK